MTTLQQRLRDEMVRRNYSPSTIRTYLHALRTCERYNRAFRANSSQLARSGKWKDVKDLRGRWIVNERRISA